MKDSSYAVSFCVNYLLYNKRVVLKIIVSPEMIKKTFCFLVYVIVTQTYGNVTFMLLIHGCFL